MSNLNKVYKAVVNNGNRVMGVELDAVASYTSTDDVKHVVGLIRGVNSQVFNIIVQDNNIPLIETLLPGLVINTDNNLIATMIEHNRKDGGQFDPTSIKYL